jgi:hypothetical protein
VTRNKLTFRDNLALLLESASPTDRQLEKRFKEWLAKCHKELDRTIKFEALCSQAIQVGGPARLTKVILPARLARQYCLVDQVSGPASD